MKTLLLFISDIHITAAQAENEGLVINCFIKDIEKQLAAIPHEEVYVLIGGDLVQAADNAESYTCFNNLIVAPIVSLGIPLSHIFCVPGNHDVQRDWINKHKAIYAPMVSKGFNENTFNNLVEDDEQNSVLTDKFSHYTNFTKSILDISTYNPAGYSVEIGEDWSLYCLNSSLTSFGGIEDKDYLSLKDDKGKLYGYTRGLYDWAMHNQKNKILMMHHPFDFFHEDIATELKKIVKTRIELVLTGHTHDQDILCNNRKEDSFIWCMAPQLYTDKGDRLGYSIISINDNDIDKIIYREWFPKRNDFRAGLDFTEEEDGIVSFPPKNTTVLDRTSVLLEEAYRDSMAVYNGQPIKWIDRFFSYTRFDRSYKLNTKNLFSEDDILKSKANIKVVAPSEYGLTAFAWHFIYKKLWCEKKEFGLYLDAVSIKKGNLQNLSDAKLKKFDKNRSDVKRIVIDNWGMNDKKARAVITSLSQLYPDIPILILCPQLENRFVESEYTTSSEFYFKILFMAPMQTGQIRSLVELYNSQKHMEQDTDIVLKRLNDDIQDFNMHRSPLNCITLLEVFSYSFDDNPVNRTAVIDRILHIIFENEKVPTYKFQPDVKDCEFAIGYFCEQMIRNKQYYFSNKDFVGRINEFCKKQITTLDVNYLFEVLLHNNILCQYEADLFGFRFAYWVYYFAAMRMTKSEDFTKFILCNQNYINYPEIIEFYTGYDRNRNDAADIVTKDITDVSSKVHDDVGLSNDFNPFAHLKLQLSDAQIEKALGQLDANLQRSKLPTDIKDAMTDLSYNPSRPYYQSVNKVFENYSINYLQEMIAIASKALRNSDYIEPEKKVALIKAITSSWLNIVKVITLMAPALSKEGFANYGNFRLALAEGFEHYKDDPKGTLIDIISSIPENLMRWYKNNIYSSKLSQLFFDTISKEQNPVIRHLLISLVIYEQPDGWFDVVKNYLVMVGHNSYYFGDAITSLKYMYSVGVMSDSNLNRTRNLIKLGYTKMLSTDHKMHPELANRIINVLPQRETNEE